MPRMSAPAPVPHASHPRIAARLKRAEGHLRHVVGMIESGAPCTEIAQQLHAVERAVAMAKRTLIHDHIDHCLTGDAADPASDLSELKAIARYL